MSSACEHDCRMTAADELLAIIILVIAPKREDALLIVSAGASISEGQTSAQCELDRV